MTKAGKITNQMATAVIVYSCGVAEGEDEAHRLEILLLGAAASARAAPEALDQ